MKIIMEEGWHMEDFGKWVLEHNPGGHGRYILSVIGVVSYFVIFTLFMGDVTWQAIGMLIFLVGVASWDMGRYCVNRFLYIKEAAAFCGNQAVSRVLRFHAFDVDEYFAGLRKKLYFPILAILICIVFSAGAVLFDGRRCVSRIIVVLFTGMIGVAMVCVAYLMKKRQINRELQEAADSVRGTWLKVCSIIFAGVEVLGIIIGPLVAVVFLWVIVKGALQPAVNDTAIVYRSYAESNDLIFVLLGVAALVAGIVQSAWTWFRKMAFLFCGACIIAGGIMICMQNEHYTEVEGSCFRVYDSGLVKEYTLEEVERFRVGWSDSLEGIQITLTFRNGESYEVLGNDITHSNYYEKKYHSEYDFVKDYAGQMLRQGTAGTLENRRKLDEYVQGQDGKVQKAWKEILALPFLPDDAYES